MTKLGVGLALLAVVFWAFSDLVTKMSLNRASKWRVVTITQLFGALLVFVIGFFTKQISIPITKELLYIILLGAINLVAFYFYYHALHKKGIALISPIINSWPIGAIVFGILVFKEQLQTIEFVAGMIIIIGMIITTKQKHISFDNTFFFAFIAMALWAISFSLVKIPIELFGVIFATAGVKLVTFLFSIPTILKKRINLFKFDHAYPFMILVGILDGLGFMTFNAAIYFSNVSIVSPIIAAVPVLAVILGIYVLKERVTKKQSIGIIITLCGIFLVSL